MSRINSRIVLPSATGLLGAFWLIYGLIKYGWWGDNGPQSGFFPAIVGSLLLIVSILAIIGSVRKEGTFYLSASFHPLFAAVAVIAASFVIGFFPALFLFLLGWIRFYEKYNWMKALLTSVITTGVFFGVFSLWLRVPFPEGLILDLIKG